jgi:integral membrane protein (TIGR01906 family)
MRAKDRGSTSQAARRTRSRKAAENSTTLRKSGLGSGKQLKRASRERSILVAASAVLLVIIVLTASFFLVFIDRGFYDKSFGKYGTYSSLGVDGPRKIIDYLINYFTSESTKINEVQQLTLFTDKEQAHLADVQHIIVFVKYLGIVCLIALILVIVRLWLRFHTEYEKYVYKAMLIAGIGVIAVIIMLFLLSINFPSFFDSFHRLLFPQGNYTFSQDSLLITLFPQAFFQDFARKMLIHAAVMGIILIFLGASPALTFRNPRRDKMRRA